jgi:hypothetical protein
MNVVNLIASNIKVSISEEGVEKIGNGVEIGHSPCVSR